MRYLHLSLLLAITCSCTASFRGSFLVIDEFKFGPIPHLEKILDKEVESEKSAQ